MTARRTATAVAVALAGALAIPAPAVAQTRYQAATVCRAGAVPDVVDYDRAGAALKLRGAGFRNVRVTTDPDGPAGVGHTEWVSSQIPAAGATVNRCAVVTINLSNDGTVEPARG